ncbi:MAG: hypothetical protein V1645_01330 [archaeon]
MFSLTFVDIVSVGIVLVIPFWFIFRKAGYSPWWCLLLFIPLVNIFAIYFLAFGKWPVIKKLKHLEGGR